MLSAKVFARFWCSSPRSRDHVFSPTVRGACGLVHRPWWGDGELSAEELARYERLDLRNAALIPRVYAITGSSGSNVLAFCSTAFRARPVRPSSCALHNPTVLDARVEVAVDRPSLLNWCLEAPSSKRDGWLSDRIRMECVSA